MGKRTSDENCGRGPLVESGEAVQGEEVSAALRLLIVHNDPKSGPETLERVPMAGSTSSSGCPSEASLPSTPLDNFAGVLVLGGLRECVFEYHTYGISAPLKATVLATTRGDHQLFRVGEGTWGRQSYLKIDLLVLAIKLVDVGDELEQGSVDAKALLKESAGTVDARLCELGEQVAHHFLALCTNETTKGEAA
jgi:hypothetical protein